MRRTSGNIMNELGRSILSLYSYDPDPDDLSVDNLLRQSVELIGYFPSIVANAYAVKRHHFGGRVPAHPLPGGGTQHGGELPADDPSG